MASQFQALCQARLQPLRSAVVSYHSYLASFTVIRNVIFILFLLRIFRRSFYTVRGYGFLGTARRIFSLIRVYLYGFFLRFPVVRAQVDKEVLKAITGIEEKLAQTSGLHKYKSLPSQGWSTEAVSAELDKLAGMDHTKWEDGHVSGAVYHGGEELLKVQLKAYDRFAVANPIHPDVFPGVRKMEAEIVAMVSTQWRVLISLGEAVCLQ